MTGVFVKQPLAWPGSANNRNIIVYPELFPLGQFSFACQLFQYDIFWILIKFLVFLHALQKFYPEYGIHFKTKLLLLYEKYTYFFSKI